MELLREGQQAIGEIAYTLGNSEQSEGTVSFTMRSMIRCPRTQ